MAIKYDDPKIPPGTLVVGSSEAPKIVSGQSLVYDFNSMRFELLEAKAEPVKPEKPDYDPDRTYDQLEAIAESYGCNLITPDDNQLLLDFDGDYGEQIYENNKNLIHTNWPIAKEEWWQSKSGGNHFHLRVTLESDLDGNTVPEDEYARSAMQAALGSDRTREAINLLRIHEGAEVPSCLFKPKDAVIYPSLKKLLEATGQGF